MLNVYVDKLSERVKYTFEFVFSRLIITDYRLIDKFDDFTSAEGFKIVYANQKIEDYPLIYAFDFLFDADSDKIIEVECDTVDLVKVLFPHNCADSIMSFDIFAAIFYMISRYEEYSQYNSSVFDEHGRYLHVNSTAYREKFMDSPVVHIWCAMLEDKLKQLFPQIVISHPQYEFIPTIDVDNAYKHINKGVVRVWGGVAKSLLHLDFKLFNEKMSVIFRHGKDPYDVFDELVGLQKKYDICFRFFFLMGDYGGNDKACPPSDKKFRKLIRDVHENAKVGIHPSYASNDDISLLPKEKKLLEDVIGAPVTMSRQHFLRFNVRNTFSNLLNNGIKEDYSMGYAEIVGFRAGVCVPYNFFDLGRNIATDLVIYPLSAMDATLFRYMKLNDVEAFDEIRKTIEVTKKYNGTFIPLWHNSSLADNSKRKLFVKMIEAALN